MYGHDSHAVLKVLNFEIGFQDLKSIEFGQNVHEVLKKYGHFKFSQLFIPVSFYAADESFAEVFCVVS